MNACEVHVPSISVVIPTYNNAPYLGAALDSVLSQSFRDCEIVVVDDGSTDETAQVLARYGDRVRCHSQVNQGLAVARNSGLDVASGEFVTYLDGDDMMCRENLARKHAMLGRHPELGGVFSDFEVFGDQGTIHETGIRSTFGFFRRTGKRFDDIFSSVETAHGEGGQVERFYHGNIFEHLFLGNFILPSSMVFRKAFADEVGRFVPALRTQQDYEYWLRFSKARPFGYLDQVLVRYRRHARQLTDRSNIVRVLETALGIVAGYEQEFVDWGRTKAFNRRKAEMLQSLAKAYVARGRNREARQALAEALRRDPKRLSSAAHYLVAMIPSGLVNAIYRSVTGRR